VKAAENKDRAKIKERDQAHADTLLSVSLNANYIVMRVESRWLPRAGSNKAD
jgi:hypothetical protein